MAWRRGLPVWVSADVVDFRPGIDGLALRVQASLGPQRAFECARVLQPWPRQGQDSLVRPQRVVVDVQAPGARAILVGDGWVLVGERSAAGAGRDRPIGAAAASGERRPGSLIRLSF